MKNFSVVVVLALFLGACGGSGSKKDTVSPVVAAPSSVTVAAVDSSGTPASASEIAAFLQGASATDDVDSSVTVTNNAPSVFPLGDTSVTFTATDAAGNRATATAVVTVTDQSSPTLSVPADAGFVATSAAGIAATDDAVAAFLALATASDNVDSSVTVTNNAPATFAIGETTVVFSASDAAGNTVSDSVVVTVTGASQVGAVVKGPLVNAIVFFDYDGDNELDADEPSTTTDENGEYTLAETSNAPDDYSIVVLMAEETIDVLSGESYADSGVELSAAKGGEVITPITTLYAAALSGLAEGETLSEEEFSAAFGLPEGVDIANYNPYAKDADGNYVDLETASAVEAVAQSIMTALEVISESVVAMSKTALTSETGVSQQQAGATALKALAKVAAAAAKAPAGTSAASFDLTDLDDISDVNNAVLDSLSSTDEGSLGALVQDAAAAAGTTADIAAATVTGSVALNVSAKTIATVSSAFNAVSTASFGTSAASAVSRLKAQAVSESAQAAAIVVQAVGLQQAAGQTVVLTESDVDVSGVVTLDNAESVQAAVALNEQEVTAYLLTTVAPVIQSAASFEAAENQTSIGQVIAVDTAGDILSYSLSGADASALSISSSGVLVFNSAPDFETKALYQVTVKVVDSNGNAVSQNITITITDANDDAPVISSSSAYSANENQTEIGSVVASSPSGAALVYGLSGSDAALLAISTEGVLSFVSAPDYEIKSKYSAIVTVSDGTNETSVSITVSVVNLNDEAPVITSASAFTVKENQRSIGRVTASDADFSALSYGVSGADAGAITISTLGILRFETSPDYEAKSSYSFNVSVSDGVSTSTAAVVVTIVNVNDVAPTISGSGEFSVSENETTVGTVTALDVDSSDLTYSLSGADAAEFTISSAGVLSFVTAPDFERDDLSYALTVVVSDGLFTASKAITVTVTDEPDTFTFADTSVTIDDYLPLDGSTVINEITYSIENGRAVLDLRAAPLNLTNIQNAVYGGDFKTPVVTFGLSSLPVGSGSGIVNLTLIDGLDANRDSGERQVNVQLAIDWDSDGTVAAITVPSQDITASYKTRDGVEVEVEVVNADPDVLSVTGDGAIYPATLEIKLVSLLTQLSGLPIGDILSAGVYHLEVTTSLPLKASSGENVDGLNVIVEIVDAFRLAESVITVTDYYPLDGTTVTNEVAYSVEAGMAMVDLRVAPLNLTNIENAIYGGDFQTPVVSFALSSLPVGSGSETIAISLVDGLDGTRDSGEREIHVELSVDWISDGNEAWITVPVQDLVASYTTKEGVQIDVELSNADADMLSITSDGATYPASLEIKLASLIKQLGSALDGIASVGVFHLNVSTSLALTAPSGESVDGLSVIIEIVDAFKLADSEITLIDYDPSSGEEVATVLDVDVAVVDGFLTADLRDVPLNLLNMENAVSGSDFRTPVVSFGLSAIPSGSGTETVTMNLIDGTDAVRDDGERQVGFEFTVDWMADRVSATITAPAQEIEAFYKTRDGVEVAVSVSNIDSDVLSISQDGAIYPATLDIKLLGLIGQLKALPLASLLSAGVYHVDITTTMSLVDPTGLAFDGLKVIIEIK